MQTFLPYSSYYDSAKALDNKRLGKQRIEAKQILEQHPKWANHPAMVMWRDFPEALCMYGLEVCLEWRSRGFKDNQRHAFIEHLRGKCSIMRPFWNPELHSSHRAALKAKDPNFYEKYGWEEEPSINYIWPTEPLLVVEVGLKYYFSTHPEVLGAIR